VQNNKRRLSARYQGAEAFRLWTGIEPPVEIMKKSRFGSLEA